jgi:Divergent InlB B-repeat domain
VNGPLTPAPQNLVTGQSNPAAGGIVSGSSTVVSGQTVSLLAQANPGYSFQSWTNCALPNGSTCIVTANADTMVTANFTIQPITLNIQIPVPDSVTVTGPNISCSQSCNVQVTPGQGITLSATLADNKKLTSFSGCSSTSGNSCVLNPTLGSSPIITVNTANIVPGPDDNLVLEPRYLSGGVGGSLDAVDTAGARGWICQHNVLNSLKIKVYVGTVANRLQTFVGEFVADRPNEQAVNDACSTPNNSPTFKGRFRFLVPYAALKDHPGKVVTIVGITKQVRNVTGGERQAERAIDLAAARVKRVPG